MKRDERRRELEEEAQEEESPVECSGGEAEQLVFIPWEASGTIPCQDQQEDTVTILQQPVGGGLRGARGGAGGGGGVVWTRGKQAEEDREREREKDGGWR